MTNHNYRGYSNISTYIAKLFISEDNAYLNDLVLDYGYSIENPPTLNELFEDVRVFFCEYCEEGDEESYAKAFQDHCYSTKDCHIGTG